MQQLGQLFSVLTHQVGWLRVESLIISYFQYLLELLVAVIVYSLIIELSLLMVVLNVRPVIRKGFLQRPLN